VADELTVYIVGEEWVEKLVPTRVGQVPVRAVPAKSGNALMQQLSKDIPDVLLMEAKHAADRAGSLVEVRSTYQDLPVIIVGKQPTTEAVVDCMRKGAEDFVALEEGADLLGEKLQAAAERHRLAVQVKQLTAVYQRGGKLDELVGVSPAMHEIYARIKSISATDATVLISGESGTGKELVAHAIHNLSPRREGTFVTVNCAAIPKDLLESELFGHEKGAFTSADRQHIGSCERSHHGTLFLDEISGMDLGLQSKMLRFLQNHAFTRVGGTENIEVDSRVISATNRDPMEEVQNGRLRDDLYYRLNVVPIHVPPLRERPEDIPVLAQHFLVMMGEKYNKYFWDFSADAVQVLLRYPWPGNVRELRNMIERIVVLATTDRVTPELFPERVIKAAGKGKVPPLAVEEALACIKKALQAPPPAAEETNEVLPFAEVEKRAILGAIKKCSGDISKAARKLGLSRATLYRKLEKYGAR
jgi:DNA-binding NtrC family response regulator